MKTKLIPVLLFAVLLPLFLNSCDDQGGGNHYRSPTHIRESCIVKTDGSDFKVIGSGNNWGDYTFLPNSNKILYTSYVDGLVPEYTGLYIINTDGSGNSKLLGNEHKINRFSLSPDSKKMLVSTGDGIYVIDTGGEIATQKIQANLQDVRNASFSEDMTKIVFQQNYDINIMDASGSNIKAIKKANDTTFYVLGGTVFNDSLIVYLEKRKSEPTYIVKSYSLMSGTETYYYNYFDEAQTIFTLNDGKVLIAYGNEFYFIDLVYFWLGAKAILDRGPFSIARNLNKMMYVKDYNLYMVNIDGFYDKKLIYTDQNKQYSLGKPVLSPDGQYIFFTRTQTIW